MKRFDLRHLKNDFYTKMGEILDSSLQNGEVGIFLYELGEFSNVAKSAEFMRLKGCEILNSVRFNHCDWTLVVRKGGKNLANQNLNENHIDAQSKNAQNPQNAQNLQSPQNPNTSHNTEQA
ncbi:NADH-ubiquinone oxidoreductase subunit E family protein [Helicobacter sp. T3_23-1056]